MEQDVGAAVERDGVGVGAGGGGLADVGGVDEGALGGAGGRVARRAGGGGFCDAEGEGVVEPCGCSRAVMVRPWVDNGAPSPMAWTSTEPRSS